MPKNVGDLDKLIVAKGFEKSNKLPNLVTLLPQLSLVMICKALVKYRYSCPKA